MVHEVKKPTTIEEQINILKRHGCFVSDEAFCRQILESISYYRLSAYFLPFKTDSGMYKEGTSFHRVYRIYEFDRKLRAILFSALEEVEIYLRSRVSSFHAHKYGSIGYLDESSFSGRHDHTRFQDRIELEIKNNQKILFVKHHVDNYDGKFPLWVIFELFTFGMLSYFFTDLKTQDKKNLASKLYNTVPQNIISWLRCCTDLRNICAHYGRLYYRIFPAAPGGLPLSNAARHRLWGAVCALRQLYPDKNKWNYEVLASLASLFEEYNGDISLYHLAFPNDWSKQLRK